MPVSPYAGQAKAALAGLAVLKAVMLAALLTGTEPHPPGFLAPLIGAGLALGAVAWVLLSAGQRGALWPIAGFGLLTLLDFGPHKLLPGSHPFFFAQTPAVYPAVIVGTLLLAMLAWAAWRLGRG